MLLDSLRDQWTRLIQPDDEIRKSNCVLKQYLGESSDCQKIAEIPGIGLLTATAAVVSLGCDNLPFWSPVRGLVGTGSSTNGHWWQSSATGAEQARRHLSANAVDAWRSLDPQ